MIKIKHRFRIVEYESDKGLYRIERQKFTLFRRKPYWAELTYTDYSEFGSWTEPYKFTDLEKAYEFLRNSFLPKETRQKVVSHVYIYDTFTFEVEEPTRTGETVIHKDVEMDVSGSSGKVD